MMNHGENNITVVDEEGNEQLCEVLFTFDSEEFGKSYVLYYPIGADEKMMKILKFMHLHFPLMKTMKMANLCQLKQMKNGI